MNSRVGVFHVMIRLAMVVAVVSLIAVPCKSQESQFGPKSPSNAMLASQLVLAARGVLSGPNELRKDQYERAEIILRLALELKSDDKELWRLKYDLARAAADWPGQRQALKQYIRLAPNDDAAQLQYIRILIESEQGIDRRLAKVESILDGPGAKKGLTKALRSRLASYCASAASEIGDRERFIQRLVQALELDKSNEEAAAMYLDHVIAQGLGPKEIGVALMWCIRASPLATEPRRQLAELLLAQRAYAAAETQFAAVSNNSEGNLDREFYYDWVLSLASLGSESSTQNALSVLAGYEMALGQSQGARPEDPIVVNEILDEDKWEHKDKEEREKRKKQKPGLLPLDLELLRLAIVHHSKFGASAEGSFGRIGGELMKRRFEDPQAMVDMVWLKAWLGPVPPTSQQIEAMESDHGKNNPLMQRIRGWTAIRENDFDAARMIFEQADRSDPFVLYGLSQTYHQAPDDIKRVKLLEKVIDQWPSSLVGMLAAHELGRVNKTVIPSLVGQYLMRRLDEWPADLREPNLQKLPWTSINVDVEPKRFKNLQPIGAMITLRNASEVPLSVGPNGTIPSRLFIYIKSQSAGITISTTPPIVVDMQRRLHLEAGETMAVAARLDLAEFGMILKNHPFKMVDFNVTAIFDPRPQVDGTVSHGLVGAMGSENFLEYWREDLTIQNVEKWLEQAIDTNPIRRLMALSRLESGSVYLYEQIKTDRKYLKRVIDTQAGKEVDKEFQDSDPDVISNLQAMTTEEITALEKKIEYVEQHIDMMGEVINTRFYEMDRVEQAWTLLFLPRTEEIVKLFAPVYEHVERSHDPLLRIIYLAIHVRSAQSTLITDALRESDLQIVAYAKALQDGFAAVAASVRQGNK